MAILHCHEKKEQSLRITSATKVTFSALILNLLVFFIPHYTFLAVIFPPLLLSLLFLNSKQYFEQKVHFTPRKNLCTDSGAKLQMYFHPLLDIYCAVCPCLRGTV